MKTIIVSGAAGSLGEITVETFAKTGYRVIGTVSKNTSSSSPSIHYATLDLSNEKQAEEFIKASIEQYGSIQAAALLAGGFAMGTLADTSEAALDAMLQLNFKTAYNLIRPLFSHMMENGGGTLIVIGSKPAVDLKLGKNMVAYTLSKSLLLNLVEILNEIGKEKGVAIHALIPGTIDTEENRRAIPSADFSTWVKAETLAAKMLALVEAPYRKDQSTVHPFF